MNMEIRNSALEKSASQRVRREVGAIVGEACTKLKRYVEDASDASLLTEISHSMTQVARTLKVLQVHGGVVLAREMHEVIEALINDDIRQKDRAQECLSRGILQLSRYLEYAQEQRKDFPIVLLPLLNDLRGVREAPLLTEHVLFFPDLDNIEVPNIKMEMDLPERDYAGKIRYGYQIGLISLIQNRDIDAAATKMCKVLIRLHQCSTQLAARRLWWVCSAVTQALAIQALPTSTGLASLLGQVDRQIKQFAKQDEAAFVKQLPSGLIKNLLYYVAAAEPRGRIVSKVKQAYGLDDSIPSETDIDKMRENLSSPSADVLEAVSRALREDIEAVKDLIELHLYSENHSAKDVIEIRKDLQKIADTLGMLGLEESREAILREIAGLKSLKEQEPEKVDKQFASTAETIIKTENTVDDFVHFRTVKPSSSESIADEQSAPRQSGVGVGQLGKIRLQAIGEVLDEIEKAKNTFSYLLSAPEDEEKYVQLQDHFRRAMGVLSVLNLDDVGKILEYIQIYLLDGDAIPELIRDHEKLDNFADAITSVKCYLEAFTVAEEGPNDILEYGIVNVSELVGENTDPSSRKRPVQTVEIKELGLEDESSEKAGEDDSKWETDSMSTPEEDILAEPSFSEIEADPQRSDPDPEASSLNTSDFSAPQDLTEDRLDDSASERLFEDDHNEDQHGSAELEPSEAMLREAAESESGDAVNPDTGEEGRNAELRTVAPHQDAVIDGRSDFQEADDRTLAETMVFTEGDEGSAPQSDPLEYKINVEVDGVRKTLLAKRGAPDPEELGFFIEEAKHEIEKINLNCEVWQADLANEDALMIVRQAFHTLKDNARLLGAEILSEYSWQIESVLNKVIGKSLADVGELRALLESSVILLKELVLQLDKDHTPTTDIVELFSCVNRVAARLDDLERMAPSESHEQPTMPTHAAAASPKVNDHERKTTPGDRAFDEKLFALFINEANQHIKAIEELVEPGKEYRILTVDEPLLYILHALFGCSRTVEARSIFGLIGALDARLQEYKQHKQALKHEEFDVFIECIEYVKQALTFDRITLMRSGVEATLLDKVNSLLPMDIPMLQDVVSDVHIAGKTTPSHMEENGVSPSARMAKPREHLAASADVYEGKDEELVTIFLEEASDILETCDACLEKWHNNHQDEVAIAEFRRQLHTLKGSARMATYANIGDISHTFETLVISIADHRTQADDDIFNIIQRCLDQLHEMVDQAVAKQPVYPASRLIQNIDALLKGASADAAAKPAELEESSALEGIEAPDIREKDEDPVKDEVIKTRSLRVAAQPNDPKHPPPLVFGSQAVKLQSDVLDTLVNKAGEVNIFQARLEQVRNNHMASIHELEQVVNRLRDQFRNLEIETETQILSRYAHEDHRREEFDPLELDRYSNIQQLSRSLAEGVNDLNVIKEILSHQVHESEILLLQQRRASGDLQEGLMRTRMVQFAQVVPRLQRIVRQTSRELGKAADLKVTGADTEIDNYILNRIAASLEHLVRNAISHGIEPPGQRSMTQKSQCGEVTIKAARKGAEIVIVVRDDGSGLDVEKIRDKASELGLIEKGDIPGREIWNLILFPGVSTASEISQVSGRGIGMDVVSNEIKQLGGSLQIDTDPGHGTAFTIHIPFTLAITQSLLLKCADETYAVPLTNVEGVVRISAHELKQKYAKEPVNYHYAGQDYYLCHLGSLLSVCEPQLDGVDKMLPVLLVRTGRSRMAIQVDATFGHREIVVKPLAGQLSRLPVVSGATVLGDGNVVLILDVPGLMRLHTHRQTDGKPFRQKSTVADVQPTIMVVDDSITIRKVTTRLLERNHYRVSTAKDGLDAVQKLQEFTPALILLDIEMPRMDGYEVATHVRSNERLKDVPIIMITSRTGEKHYQRAMDIGVQEYLGKPYSEAKLLSHVQEALGDACL